MPGGVQIGDDGIVIGDDGVVVTDADDTPCCCGAYRQARYCDDDTLADAWFTSADAATLTGAFKLTATGDTCYRFAGDTGTPGTIYTPDDVSATYENCASCACECCDAITVFVPPIFGDAAGTYDMTRVSGCGFGSLYATADYDPDDIDATTAYINNSGADGANWGLIVHTNPIQNGPALTGEDDVVQCPDAEGNPITGEWHDGITVTCVD